MAVDHPYADAQPEPGRAVPAGGRAGTDLTTPLPLADVWTAGEAVLDSVEQVVVGKRHPLTLLLAGILAGGHVLLEDYPGLGRRWRRSLAQTLGLNFRRLQFPRPLPSDVTGSFVCDQRAAGSRSGPARCSAGCCSRRDQPHAAEDPVGAAGGDARRQVTVEGTRSRCPSRST